MRRFFGNVLAVLLLSSFACLFVAGILLDAHEVNAAIIEWKQSWGLP